MKASFRLFSIRGIEIGVHYTWVFAFALIAWTLAAPRIGFYRQLFRDWSSTEYWAAGIASSLALFASVLLHELAHSFVAMNKGIPVKGITLFIFGGVSNLGSEAKKAGDEFQIAIVGPLTSIILGAALLALWNFLRPAGTEIIPDSERGVSVPLGVIFYSGFVNIAVGIFNLIPGFPLDGGRVLRAAAWGATGSMRRATNIAANVGRVVAFLMIGWGVWRVFTGGDLLGGLWVAFIGWFLLNAADSARREQETEHALSGATVRDAMRPDPVVASPNMSVDELVQESFLRRGSRAAPVVLDGRLTGIVSMTDVGKVNRADWPTTPVAAIMTREPIHTLSPEDSLETALKLLAEKDINQAVVVDGGAVVGMMGRDGLVRFAQFRREVERK